MRLRIIWSRTSQNGRWGVQVVAPADAPDIGWGVTAIRGHITALGQTNGADCFRLDPDDDADTFIVFGDDLSPVDGADTVYHDDLQGGRTATILIARPWALWRQYGYKRRDADFQTVTDDGQIRVVDPAIALAQGLVLPDDDSYPRHIDAPKMTTFGDILKRVIDQ
ncbi:MAG: hypothetical protein D6706_20140 [Chloroflexi bacterium]|nr:MAG: hypothetical protein D6706_20140 [Chloroflexota bacterium]